MSERFIRDIPEWAPQLSREPERTVFLRYQTAADPSDKLRAGLAALAFVCGRAEPFETPPSIDFRTTHVKISQATWIELFGVPEKKLRMNDQMNYLEYDLGGEGSTVEPEWTMDVEIYKGFVIRVQMSGQVS